MGTVTRSKTQSAALLASTVETAGEGDELQFESERPGRGGILRFLASCVLRLWRRGEGPQECGMYIFSYIFGLIVMEFEMVCVMLTSYVANVIGIF